MEEKKLFSIGEVAKLYQISVGNLRHYEKIGLLSPEYVNPESGYRYYSTKQFECLNTIRYLRALDMPLDKIRSFLTNRDTDNLQEILLEHQQEVEKRRRELDLIAKKVASRIENLQDALDTEIDKIVVKEMPSRRFAILKASIIPDNYLSLEGFLRKLDGNSSSIFLGKVGLGIGMESLCQHRFSPYELVFLMLDPEDRYSQDVTVIEAEVCAAIRFRGGHEHAASYYKKLMHFIQKEKLYVHGFSKEITLIDYGFTNDIDRFVTEIQIPVAHTPPDDKQ